MADNEKQFEQDIESFLISPKGGWQKATDAGYRTGFQYDSTGAVSYTHLKYIRPLRANRNQRNIASFRFSRKEVQVKNIEQILLTSFQFMGLAFMQKVAH